MLITRQVPIGILNACQCGKQVSGTSLGAHLLEAGVQTVQTVGYSITVNAAERLAHADALRRTLCRASARQSRARAELDRDKSCRAYYDQRVDLEDWLLPVLYTTGTAHRQALRVTQPDPDWLAAYHATKAARFKAPKPTYRFVGRDLEILKIERSLVLPDGDGREPSNILLLRGMGGAGKIAQLHHLTSWWQGTGFVEQVFCFDWDEKAWNRQQILHVIAGKLFSPATFTACPAHATRGATSLPG